MTETNNAKLPAPLLAEVEKAAAAQSRSVEDLLAEAVSAYLSEQTWQRTIQSARTRAKDMGLTEGDVPRLIAESREEVLSPSR